MADVACKTAGDDFKREDSSSNLRHRKKATPAKDSHDGEENAASDEEEKNFLQEYQIMPGTYWLTRIVIIRYLGFVFGEHVAGKFSVNFRF